MLSFRTVHMLARACEFGESVYLSSAFSMIVGELGEEDR
jgi:hypothetical protein